MRLRSIYGVCVLRVGLSDVATCFGTLISAEESLTGVDISRGSEHCFAASRSKTRIVKSAGASVLPDICASISRWVIYPYRVHTHLEIDADAVPISLCLPKK